MSTKTSTAAAAAEESAEETAAVTEAEETAEITEAGEDTSEVEEEEAAEDAAEESGASEPMAYIGPTIKHVAQSGRVYIGDLPAALTEKIEEIPAIRGLIVPVSKLAASSAAAGTAGTALNNLYHAVAAKLK